LRRPREDLVAQPLEARHLLARVEDAVERRDEVPGLDALERNRGERAPSECPLALEPALVHLAACEDELVVERHARDGDGCERVVRGRPQETTARAAQEDCRREANRRAERAIGAPPLVALEDERIRAGARVAADA